jgi:hypothetical protein
MKETVLQTMEYRGYRLTEIRRDIKANPTDAVQVHWRITRVDAGVENIIGEAMSLETAKAKVDALLAK